MNYRLLVLLSLFLPLPHLLHAQEFINENSVFECDQAFEINLPFAQENNPTVFYQYEEQFSFWYRFNSTSNEYLKVELSALDSNDHYSAILFEYAGGDFCRQVFEAEIKAQKLKELAIDKQASRFQMMSQPGKTYFLCILNSSDGNCGHELKINSAEKEIRIKAIHIPCKIPELQVTKETKKELPLTENILSAFIELKDQEKAAQRIMASVEIQDLQTGNSIQIELDSTRKQALRIEAGKSYRVTCIAPGYKRFEHELIISQYLEKDSGNFPIYLKPLDRGDKFVMNHIYFHPNTYALKKEANQELSYLINFLENNPSLKINLAGHTNGNHKIKRNRAYKKRGEAWNFKGSSKKLSILRAEEIKNSLVKAGIEKERINTLGFGGEQMLIQDARTLEAIEKNVRVEVSIF